jgi:hypothetical protein
MQSLAVHPHRCFRHFAHRHSVFPIVRADGNKTRIPARASLKLRKPDRHERALLGDLIQKCGF